MRKTEAAYIAGFFDGEGCICCVKSRNNNLRLRVTIVQRTSPVLRKIAKLMNCGKVHKKKTDSSYGNSLFVWYINDQVSLLKFIQVVLPYSIVKKKQLELGLKFLSTVSECGGTGHILKPSTLKKRRKIAKQIKELKHENI